MSNFYEIKFFRKLRDCSNQMCITYIPLVFILEYKISNSDKMVGVDPAVWNRDWQKQTLAAQCIWNRENCDSFSGDKKTCFNKRICNALLRYFPYFTSVYSRLRHDRYAFP